MEEGNNNLNKRVIETFSMEDDDNTQPVGETAQANAPVGGETVQNEASVSLPTESKPHKKSKALIILILLLVLCAVGFGAYKYFLGNPTEVIKSVINKTYEDFSAGLKKYDNVSSQNVYDIFNDSLKLSGSLSFKNSQYKDLEKEKINFAVGLDYKNRKADVMANLTKGGSNLLEFNFISKNDSLYMTSNALLNKYDLGEYNFDELFDFSDLESELQNREQISLEDVDFIVRELKNALVETLDSEKMTLSKETISVNGKSVKTDKVSYEIDYETYCRLNNSIVDKILKNEALLDKLASMTGVNSEDLKDSLEETRLDIEDESEYFGKVFFSLYTKGVSHEVVKVSFTNGIDSLEYITEDNKMQFIYDEVSTKKRAEIQITEKDERYEVIVYVNNKEIVLLNFKEMNEELLDIDYVVNYEELNLKGTFKATQKSVSDKKTECNFEFTVEGEINGVKDDLAVLLTTVIESDVSVANQNINGAIKAENMTEEDSEYLMQKLAGLQDTILFKSIEKLVEGNMNLG